MAILVGDKEIARESFVVKKPLLKVVLPRVNLSYGQKLKEPLKAVATGWISDEHQTKLGFDGAIAFNDNNLKVGKYGLTYDKFCCDEYDLQVEEGYVNVLPLKVKVESASFDKVYDGKVAVTPKDIKLTGILDGDEVFCSIVAEFLDKNVGKNKCVKVIEYSLSGKDAQNYYFDLSDAEFNGNVTPLKISLVGLVAMDKVYDGTTAVTFKEGGQLNGVLQGDMVSVGVINASFVDANIGQNKRVIVKSVSIIGVDSINYQVQTTNITASIFGKKTSAVHGNN